jgi:chaperone modulatory protein CbpM
MPTSDQHFLSGDILDDGIELSVADLCRMFAVEEQHIVELVEEGVLGMRSTVSVIEIDKTEWRFHGTERRRARIALRLERDLGINVAGVALVLELLEELEQLRRERRLIE